MGRGKIEIKMIANPTNRQVTYSKRRGGIKKKAEELTKLCDAEVFILMFSNTGKLFEYCSPSTDIKTIVDKYQQVTGIDVWKPQYEMMQKKLEHLQELNNKLRREIGQRMGEELEGVDEKELRDLEHEMDASIKVVRERKYHVINTQTETYKKKLRNSELAHRKMLHDLEGCGEVMDYNLYQQEATEYEAAPFAYRVHASQSNLQEMGYGYHDLRLG